MLDNDADVVIPNGKGTVLAGIDRVLASVLRMVE
jgi:hypothetical protein